LGVSEAAAAADACKVEHDLSDETFEKFKAHIQQVMRIEKTEN
jgi:Mn-dependent DtxR family transcriptional regulator